MAAIFNHHAGKGSTYEPLRAIATAISRAHWEIRFLARYHLNREITMRLGFRPLSEVMTAVGSVKLIL